MSAVTATLEATSVDPADQPVTSHVPIDTLVDGIEGEGPSITKADGSETPNTTVDCFDGRARN